jgi:hypothetical protein
MGDKLDNAIRAIKSGDKQTGYSLLAELLRANPKGQEAELAWLWMGRAIDDPTKKRQCYERVLKLNKDNKNAQVELSLLLNTDVEAPQMTPPDPKAQQTTTLSSPTATTPTSESKLGDRFSLAGWLCFIIGIGLMVLSIGTFFIFVPLFLAAFILSILSMSKGKVTSGLLLLLATLIIAPMWGLGMFAYNLCGYNLVKRWGLLDSGQLRAGHINTMQISAMTIFVMGFFAGISTVYTGEVPITTTGGLSRTLMLDYPTMIGAPQVISRNYLPAIFN